MWRYVAVHLEGERTDIALIEVVMWTRIDSRSRTDSNSTTGEFCETDARIRWDLGRSMLFVRAIEGRPSSDPEQAVMVVERELLNAILKGDASANERYLADTYLFTGPDGTVEKKAQAIADLKSGDLKLQSASLDRAKVQVYGDTAVVTYSSNDKGPYKGKDTRKTRSNDVFVNQNGLLATLGTQGTMLPKYLASLARLKAKPETVLHRGSNRRSIGHGKVIGCLATTRGHFRVSGGPKFLCTFKFGHLNASGVERGVCCSTKAYRA
jgi:hypothetical protein